MANPSRIVPRRAPNRHHPCDVIACPPDGSGLDRVRDSETVWRCGDEPKTPERRPLPCADAEACLLVVRSPDLHGRTAGVALRRGAALPALRGVPEPGAARHGPAGLR